MRTVHIHCTELLFETLFVLKLWTESVILESKAKEEENKKKGKKDRNEKRKSQTHKQRKQVYCLAFFKNLKKKKKTRKICEILKKKVVKLLW